MISPQGVAVLVGASVAITACSVGGFDDQRQRAWASSSSAPQGIDGDYGVGISTVANGRPGLHSVALATQPAGLATVSYDEFGRLTHSGVAIAEVPGSLVLEQPLTIVGAVEDVPGADGLVAIGGLGSLNKILLYDARTGTLGPQSRREIDASLCGEGIENIGQRMVFAQTDLGNADEVELIALAGSELLVFPDISPAGQAPQCLRCTLEDFEDGVLQGLDITVANFSEDWAGDEVILMAGGTAPGRLIIFPASLVETHHVQQMPCFQFDTPPLSNIRSPAPERELDFGATVAAGFFAGDGLVEIAIAAPSTSRVYLFQSIGTSGPSGPAQTLTGVGASGEYGSVMVFGDIDGSEGDELIVADPGASPQGVRSAGQVDIFEAADEGAERVASLFDSEPREGQRFGQSLAIGEFVMSTDDVDLLVVGARGEVFTYFRSLFTQLDPRR